MKIALIIALVFLALAIASFVYLSPLRLYRETVIAAAGIIGIIIAFVFYLLFFDRGPEKWTDYLSLMSDMGLLVSALCLLLGLYNLLHDDFLARYAFGQIVRIETVTASVPGNAYIVRYQNPLSKTEEEITKYSFADGDKKVGDEVRIRYDRNAPNYPYAADNTTSKKEIGFIFAFGIVFMISLGIRVFCL